MPLHTLSLLLTIWTYRGAIYSNTCGIPLITIYIRSFLSKRIDNIEIPFEYFNEVLCVFSHFFAIIEIRTPVVNPFQLKLLITSNFSICRN